MSNDLENATKAAQCSSLLCDDLRAFAVTDDMVLHDVVIAELKIAAEQRIRLERLVDNMKDRVAKS
jgi:hypothetical protein